MLPPPRVMPALVTPFDRNGIIDSAAHRHNLGALWERDIRGFVIAGSTGEGPYLEPGERHLLVSIARKVVGKRATIICGVAAETIRAARTMMSEAVEGGADGILVLTPTTLARGRIPYVESFYTQMADSAPIPTYLYSVPAVTSYELPEPSITRLALLPNVAGIKDSGGDPVRMQRLANAVDPEFQLFTGSSQALSLSLTAGAYGAITASTNYAPDLVTRTVAAARRNPILARSDQAELANKARIIESYGVPGVKAAAAAIGLEPGWPRAPLQALPAGLRRKVEEALGF